MKVWNKETRNEAGLYYRVGDWGVEVDDSFKKENFTNIPPPDESLVDDPVPCDWNIKENIWVLDTSIIIKREATLLADVYIATAGAGQKRELLEAAKILAVADGQTAVIDIINARLAE